MSSVADPRSEALLNIESGGREPSSHASTPSCINDVVAFLLTLIKVSRPGFWHWTVVMYLVPCITVDDSHMLLTPRAISGLVFVTFPLNLLVYAMNDLKDVDIDKFNPRKGGLHGALASTNDLRKCCVLGILFLFLLPPLMISSLEWSAAWSLVVLAFNWLYNFGPTLSRVPVLDMLAPLGYGCVVPFGYKVVGGNPLNPWFWAFIVLVIFRTQLWFQRMDLVADATAGKRTTAVWMGEQVSLISALIVFCCELGVSNQWGCWAAQVWVVYSALVFLLEAYTKSHSNTMYLMFVGAIFAVLFAFPCLRESS